MLRQDGQGLVEYGLIIFLIALVVIAVLILLGAPIGAVFSGITAST
jgi:Flp pilus assembly pilin Flp